MKRRLYIKIISIFVITIIALFTVNTRVKAENCECYYTSTFLDNNIFVKVSTSGKKVSVEYYDGELGKVISVDPYYTDLNTWAKNFSFKPNSDYLKASEIEGCPNIKVVYKDSKNFGSGILCNNSTSSTCYAYYFIGDKTLGAFYDDQKANMVTDNFDNMGIESISKSNSDYIKDKIKTCSNDDDTISCVGYSNSDADRTIDFSYKKNAKSFSTKDFKFSGNSLDVGAEISKIDFKPSDLNNKCPENLYGGEKSGSWTICLDKNDVCNDETFGTNMGKNGESDREQIKLKKKSENHDNFTCNNLGTTLNYIKMVYNFIRFIVPVVIVLLSAIDFITVVISGETEKMEKAKRKFVIRLLVGILILFIPIILEMILKIVGILKPGENLIDIACLGD